MKKFTYLAFVALSLLTITSCTKTVVDMDAPNGNNSSANGGPDVSNVNFDWTGNAPLSVKINGTPYVCDPNLTDVISFAGYYYITFSDIEGADSKGFGIQVGENAIPNKIYTMPSPFNVSYQEQNNNIHWGAKSGKYKIITNDATTIEGYFYATLKEQATGIETGKATEGYFKVTKP